MMRLIFVFTVLLFSLSSASAQEDSDQQFLEFNLSGHSKDGQKSWEVKGESADIFSDTVRLKNVNADLYGQEKVNLKADSGSLNKASGDMHLEKDVVAITETGSKLTTDSLDWKRDANLITTEDKVKIEKENLVAVGTGAEAKTDIKKAKLKDDVTVEIATVDENKNLKKTVITCDGSLDIDYQNSIAVFNKNVLVEDEQGKIFSDLMEVYFDTKTKSIIKIIAKGHVKIKRQENESYSEEAVYTVADKKITLIGRPKLILYSEQGALNNAPFGN
ncbi:MAG: LPS export ABC transporter periplasmic protein LptC [Candidatus Omnitrophica bacterium]|nr:LPS export ABC transporter periplasmic protein LptC [Candidatus Omnitrophota bacterium]